MRDSSSFNYIDLVDRLLEMPRTGWVKRGIPNPETVAVHITRVQNFTRILASAMGEDTNICTAMAHDHDLVEAVAGDVSVYWGASQDEKSSK